MSDSRLNRDESKFLRTSKKVYRATPFRCERRIPFLLGKTPAVLDALSPSHVLPQDRSPLTAPPPGTAASGNQVSYLREHEGLNHVIDAKTEVDALETRKGKKEFRKRLLVLEAYQKGGSQ
jgi:hypothetical protein